MEDRSPRSGYATVRGLNLYYEIHGTGEPLLLLHGGVAGIPMFGPTLPALAQSRQVIAIELHGHGRSADRDRPLTFEAMADDVVELMRQLGIRQADVLGCSLGGGVALQTVIRHPDAVRKLVIVSAPCRQEGWYPEVRADFARMGPETAEPMKHSPLSQLFPDVNWAVLFTKLGDLLSREYDWSSDIAAITAPTQLVFADADAIRPEHIVEFFGLLGGGQRDAGLDGTARTANQLAILPGLTHYNIITAPGLAAVVAPFLEAPLP